MKALFKTFRNKKVKAVFGLNVICGLKPKDKKQICRVV